MDSITIVIPVKAPVL